MTNEITKYNKRKKTKNIKQNERFINRLIKITRVSKVTKGGKKLSFRAIVIVGNKNGTVGIGVGKADDVLNAFKKAKADGQKNLIKIPLTKTLTIPHGIVGDFGACSVIMRPSIEGSGVVAGGTVRMVLEVAGVKNIIAKQLGSNNLLNNARAAITALKTLTTKEEVEKNRQIKL